MSKHNPDANYTQLVSKVDDWFQGVIKRYPREFSCTAGCHGCCRAGLTVLPVEAEHLTAWIQEHPAVKEKLMDSREMHTDPQYCEFLDKEGRCVVYDARPIICRSHGAPVSWVETEVDASGECRDVCPLNFQGVNLENLDGQSVISLEKVNTLLSLVNRNYLGSDNPARIDLSLIAGLYKRVDMSSKK